MSEGDADVSIVPTKTPSNQISYKYAVPSHVSIVSFPDSVSSKSVIVESQVPQHRQSFVTNAAHLAGYDKACHCKVVNPRQAGSISLKDLFITEAQKSASVLF